jgi:tRNA(Glu) U13 pseudouridine synthase TruD
MALPEANYFLKNIHPAPEAVSMNNISGNRFTLFIRTPKQIDEQVLQERLDKLSSAGFYNFYWLQRFGNRLLSHWWGLCLLQGKEEKTVRSYLTDPGPNELPFFAELRKQANTKFEKWEEMIKLFEPLGFSMRYELLLLNYLKEFRHDYTGALRSISEQVKMWVYAYGSFLFNKILSVAAGDQKDFPDQIPLLLSNNLKDHEIYRTFLEADKISADFAQKIRRFDFIRLTPRKVETKLQATILNQKVLSEGVVISFDLPKGAYATTFLSHIFSLDGSILPDLNPTKYDLKEILGSGNLSETLKKLEKYIVIRETQLTEE